MGSQNGRPKNYQHRMRVVTSLVHTGEEGLQRLKARGSRFFGFRHLKFSTPQSLYQHHCKRTGVDPLLLPETPESALEHSGLSLYANILLKILFKQNTFWAVPEECFSWAWAMVWFFRPKWTFWKHLYFDLWACSPKIGVWQSKPKKPKKNTYFLLFKGRLIEKFYHDLKGVFKHLKEELKYLNKC